MNELISGMHFGQTLMHKKYSQTQVFIICTWSLLKSTSIPSELKIHSTALCLTPGPKLWQDTVLSLSGPIPCSLMCLSFPLSG